jgi:hypothetical protein
VHSGFTWGRGWLLRNALRCNRVTCRCRRLTSKQNTCNRLDPTLRSARCAFFPRRPPFASTPRRTAPTSHVCKECYSDQEACGQEAAHPPALPGDDRWFVEHGLLIVASPRLIACLCCLCSPSGLPPLLCVTWRVAQRPSWLPTTARASADRESRSERLLPLCPTPCCALGLAEVSPRLLALSTTLGPALKARSGGVGLASGAAPPSSLLRWWAWLLVYASDGRVSPFPYSLLTVLHHFCAPGTRPPSSVDPPSFIATATFLIGQSRRSGASTSVSPLSYLSLLAFFLRHYFLHRACLRYIATKYKIAECVTIRPRRCGLIQNALEPHVFLSF